MSYPPIYTPSFFAPGNNGSGNGNGNNRGDMHSHLPPSGMGERGGGGLNDGYKYDRWTLKLKQFHSEKISK